MAMARSGEPAKTLEAYMIESMKHWRPVKTPAAAIFLCTGGTDPERAPRNYEGTTGRGQKAEGGVPDLLGLGLGF